MPSFTKIITAAAGLAAVASALPAQPRFTPSQMNIYSLMKRQNAAAAASGLSDIDILQYALTLEWLEATFYQQGFAKFPASDFSALGLNEQQINDLDNVAKSEQDHVVLLQSAIAQAGFRPVQPCTYDFGFTDAAGMVATAAVLENVGVSAYLGAAPLLTDATILSTAGSILTTEARHQTFIRGASGAVAIPQPFDTPLSARQVFSLAAPFIKSCPEGSNLQVQAFPPLSMGSKAATTLVAGQQVTLVADSASGAAFCGFTNGGIPGGTAFTPFASGSCEVPQNLAGLVYLHLTREGPLNGMLTEQNIVAGPMVMTVT